MDLTMFINAALSAAGGGGVVGALVLTLYKHNLKLKAAKAANAPLEKALKDISEILRNGLPNGD